MKVGRETDRERVRDMKTRRVNLKISLKLETSEKDGLRRGPSKNNKPWWDLFGGVPPARGSAEMNRNILFKGQQHSYADNSLI